MIKEEMKLKVHYELRNHIGARALNDENIAISRYYINLYKRIKKDRTKRYLEDAEKRINEKLNKQGFVSILDVYDELGIDTTYERYLIEHGRGYDVGWLKGVE